MKNLLVYVAFAHLAHFVGINDGNVHHCIDYSLMHNIKNQCLLPLLVYAFEHLRGTTIYQA